MGQHIVSARVFAPARMVGAARLAVMDAVAQHGDAVDKVAGIQAELAHLARRADQLVDAEVFDTEARDTIEQERSEARRRLTDAQDKVWRSQLALLIAQTDSPPDLEWCLENVAPDDVDAIYRAWDPDGDTPPSRPGGPVGTS